MQLENNIYIMNFKIQHSSQIFSLTIISNIKFWQNPSVVKHSMCTYLILKSHLHLISRKAPEWGWQPIDVPGALDVGRKRRDAVADKVLTKGQHMHVYQRQVRVRVLHFDL